MADIIKRHDDDVIFSYESLQEFIRLIQRQGINNLTIYSVNALLKDDKWKTIKTRMPPPTMSQPQTEFSEEELKSKRSHLVFVRYSFPWENGGQKNNDIYISNNEKNGRHVFVKTIDDIKFLKKFKADKITIDTDNSSVFHQDEANASTIIEETDILENNIEFANKNGTFVVTIDNMQYVIKIRGFNDDGQYIGAFAPNQGSDKFLRGDGAWTNSLANNLLPTKTDTYNLGSDNYKWKNLYISGKLYGTAEKANADEDGNNIKATYATGLNYNATTQMLQLKNKNDALIGDPVKISTTDTKNTAGSTNIANKLFLIGATSQVANSITYSNSNVYTQSGYLYAKRVYNAVFNDYAECRKTIDLEAGRVIQDNDDGSLSCTSQRLIPGCHIISDTYGNLMGETDDCKTPIAVAGRVLVYPYQNRENYHAGMSVCAAPNGTVDIMTREEIINYPDCIIGTVSEIPNYETWGTDNVNVNGRIWIYVK